MMPLPKKKALSSTISDAVMDEPAGLAEPARHVVKSLQDRYEFEDQVLADRDLKPAQKVVALRLAKHFNVKTGQLNPGFETIAKGSGMGRSSTIKHIKGLLEAGRIILHSSRGRVSNGYSLICNRSHGVNG